MICVNVVGLYEALTFGFNITKSRKEILDGKSSVPTPI